MLPLHRPPAAAESLARLSAPSKLQTLSGRLLTRWLLLGVTVVGFFWLVLPLIHRPWGPSELGDVEPPGPPPHARPARPPLPPPPIHEQQTWNEKKLEVREAFRHAWHGYKTRAFPSDELHPVSGGKSDKYNGWSVTLFDSLDTMWIMGLKEEFEDAVESIRHMHFKPTKPDHYAPFFETTIRYLGGTLSAYALSAEPVLAALADELGQLLLPAFKNTKSGLPAYSVNVETGEPRRDRNKDTVLFAEATSCQLEFKYLAKITGKKEYYQRVEAAMDIFYRANVTDGLFHDKWSIKDGSPVGSHFTIGATADSGYEYLLKQWILSGDVRARDQYIKSVRGIIDNLLYLSPTRGLVYAGDLVNGNLVHRFEHLSCFLGGLLALGAHVLPASSLTESERELHEWAGKGLSYTCAQSYADQFTGLGPDEMRMPSLGGRKWVDEVEKWRKAGRVGDAPGTGVVPDVKMGDRDYWERHPAYHLRPETVESIFYMWRTTGDVKWRERGYVIFQGLEKYARTKYGYSSITSIDSASTSYLDYMPSWFMAETLKYLYLLFDDTDSITFDHWVFNTEAHPLPTFEWTTKEKQDFGIAI